MTYIDDGLWAKRYYNIEQKRCRLLKIYCNTEQKECWLLVYYMEYG